MSKEIIKAPRPNNNILSPTTENTFDHRKIKLKFNGSCLIQNIYTSNNSIVYYLLVLLFVILFFFLFIYYLFVYEITKKYSISGYPTLENCLFGSVKLIKNLDIDEYK